VGVDFNSHELHQPPDGHGRRKPTVKIGSPEGP
jgi:hypothetical protein